MIQHKHFHILLFFVASSSSSLPRATVAQSATQPIAARAFQGSVNPSIAVVAVVLVLVVLVTGFCSIYLRQCSETYVISGNRIGAGDCSRSPQGIKPEVLATFPMLVYSAMKDLKVGKCAQQCAVCLSEFRDCETLRLLPKCSHVFHPDCIDAWLASHVTCPVCRAKLKPDCSEVRVVIGDSTNAHQVFDESSVRSAEVGATEQQDHQQQQEVEMNGSSKVRTFGMLVRSHSTGHSLVEPGKNLERERYTPSSPEEARKHILDEHGSMKRSVSYSVILQSEGCSGKGWWSRGEVEGEGSSKDSKKDGVERQNRWVLSMTPPFVVSCGWGSSGCASSTTCSGIPRFWASSSRPLLPL